MEGRVDCLDRGFDSLDLLGPELAFRHQAPSHESTKARLEVPEYLLDLSLDADHPCIPSFSCHAWCSRRRRVGSERFACRLRVAGKLRATRPLAQGRGTTVRARQGTHSASLRAITAREIQALVRRQSPAGPVAEAGPPSACQLRSRRPQSTAGPPLATPRATYSAPP